MGLERATALVTGASAGIGKALAEEFAGQGHDVCWSHAARSDWPG